MGGDPQMMFGAESHDVFYGRVLLLEIFVVCARADLKHVGAE